MVKSIRIYRNNEFTLLSLAEYFSEYNSELPEGWIWYCEWLAKVFNIKTKMEYDSLRREVHVEHFDVAKIKKSYIKLKSDYSAFDDDILKFIAFLQGTSYFSKIGDPSIEKWLNSIDINHPFNEKENGESGFSFKDAIQYKFGQNAIRKRLLSTLRWITSQSGS